MGGCVRPRNAVHAGRQQDAVPVDGGRLRQLVGHEDANAVALYRLDGRAGAGAVEAPHVHFHPRRELAHAGFGDQVELLDAIVHAPRKRPAIEGDDGVERPAGGRRRRWLRSSRRLHHSLRQRGGADPAHRRRAERDRAGGLEEVTTIRHCCSFSVSFGSGAPLRPRAGRRCWHPESGQSALSAGWCQRPRNHAAPGRTP